MAEASGGTVTEGDAASEKATEGDAASKRARTRTHAEAAATRPAADDHGMPSYQSSRCSKFPYTMSS